MARRTMTRLVVALITAFALTASIAEAAPTKTRHRAKHSSRVASGGSTTTGKKPGAKKKPAPSKPGTHAKANGAASPAAAKKATTKHRPTTKPR
jgi:hypothetical protein